MIGSVKAVKILRRLQGHWSRRNVVAVASYESLAALAATMKSDPALDEIVRQAWTAGQGFDLSDIGYGPAHWNDREKFVATPFPYYAFLAGFVRSQECKRIFEIGTHYGGSTLAMLRGVGKQNTAKIVTVDVTDLNPALHSTPGITKLVGDANSECGIKRAVLATGKEPIDLLYVDASHRFLPTITNLGLYVLIFRPRFVAIDDIALNDEMRSVWRVICATYGADAVNCVNVISEIRAKAVGFCLLRLR